LNVIVANLEVDFAAVDQEPVQLFKQRSSWSADIGLKNDMSEGVLQSKPKDQELPAVVFVHIFKKF